MTAIDVADPQQILAAERSLLFLLSASPADCLFPADATAAKNAGAGADKALEKLANAEKGGKVAVEKYAAEGVVERMMRRFA